MPTSDLQEIEIARYRSVSDGAEIDEEIAEAWRKIVDRHSSEVAHILGVKPSSLDRDRPPFRAMTKASGFDGGAILILAISTFAVAFSRDLGAALGKEVAQRIAKKLVILWDEYFEERVTTPKKPLLGERIVKKE